jgi:hypothetical protein
MSTTFWVEANLIGMIGEFGVYKFRGLYWLLDGTQFLSCSDDMADFENDWRI